MNHIAGGQVDVANPVVVDGYSQSSVISSLLMQQLASQGVPSDDVHFVLVGDESAPNGAFTGVVPTTPQDLFDTFPPHTGVPLLDVASALLITLPEIDYNVFTSDHTDNDLVNAIGIPLASDLGMIPLAPVGAVIPFPFSSYSNV